MFHIVQSGGELSLSGPRAYKTNSCWEAMPGLRVTSHSASPDRITTVCQMPAGDPRKTKITTTWTVVGDKLYFDEVGQYQFTLAEQNCSASSRKTRVLSKVIPVASTPTAAATPVPIASEKPQAPVQAKAPAKIAPAPTSQCAARGPATSLVVSPKTKLMMPGETFSFRVSALDSKRCEVPVLPRFRLRADQQGLSVTPQGRISTAPDASSGRAVLEIQAGDSTLEAVIRVVSRAEYEELLSGGTFSDAGESLDDAQVTRALVTLSPEESGSPRFALWPLVTLLAISAGVALTWLLKRHSKQNTAKHRRDEPISPQVRPSPLKVCPVCGQTYGPEATFCGSDGAHLLRQN
jgi:hypothetical protein